MIEGDAPACDDCGLPMGWRECRACDGDGCARCDECGGWWACPLAGDEDDQ